MRKVLVLIFSLLSNLTVLGQLDSTYKKNSYYIAVSVDYVFHQEVDFNLIINNDPLAVKLVKPETKEVNYTLSAGWYDVERRFLLGAGFGISNNLYGANALLYFLESKYFLFNQENSPFINVLLGLARPIYGSQGLILIDSSNGTAIRMNGLQRGNILKLGAGHKLKFFKRLSATFSINYDVKFYSYSDEIYAKSDQKVTMQGISLMLGLFIK